MAIKKTSDAVTPSIANLIRNLNTLPQKAYDFWVKTTPVDTGNARKKTTLQRRTINANYNYAVPLDKGHSRQAPQGMSKPTGDFIQKTLRQMLRK